MHGQDTEWRVYDPYPQIPMGWHASIKFIMRIIKKHYIFSEKKKKR